MTVVAIQPGTDEAFWCINAWGREKAADLAEKNGQGIHLQMISA